MSDPYVGGQKDPVQVKKNIIAALCLELRREALCLSTSVVEAVTFIGKYNKKPGPDLSVL